MTEGRLLYFAFSFIGSVQEIGQLLRFEVAQWLWGLVEDVRFELRSGGRRSPCSEDGPTVIALYLMISRRQKIRTTELKTTSQAADWKMKRIPKKTGPAWPADPVYKDQNYRQIPSHVDPGPLRKGNAVLQLGDDPPRKPSLRKCKPPLRKTLDFLPGTAGVNSVYQSSRTIVEKSLGAYLALVTVTGCQLTPGVADLSLSGGFVPTVTCSTRDVAILAVSYRVPKSGIYAENFFASTGYQPCPSATYRVLGYRILPLPHRYRGAEIPCLAPNFTLLSGELPDIVRYRNLEIPLKTLHR
ncbi:hypothetical protein EAG_06624 [Camponotus floridanus]|uniref:Uncharacterized protein n=1 Tax=Camponotus floridanus TaxID=104421 RepID=E2AL57_CAMFO|nr:hypothetical protein EAG_06624 [Camponotus floridanus]